LDPALVVKYNYIAMGDVAQIELRPRGEDAWVRALLEDLAEYYKGVYPGQPLALAVWFSKAPSETEHNLLVLFANQTLNRIMESRNQSLRWRTPEGGPPFANIYATSVSHFDERLRSAPGEVSRFLNRAEVLYFEKDLLPQSLLVAFNVRTEPSGLLKGWYVGAGAYLTLPAPRSLLAAHGGSRPTVGLLKVDESADFERCRALIHSEISRRWLPLFTPSALEAHDYYQDWQFGRPGYFLLEGGSLYQILKFEFPTAPEYSSLVLEGSRDGRYAEVYLRAVPSSEQSTA
jgi:hypothetical protein